MKSIIKFKVGKIVEETKPKTEVLGFVEILTMVVILR